MESPVKQPVFTSENKENSEVAVPIKGLPDLADLPDPEEVQAKAEASVAEGIKEEEADEPILRENGQRFVLFPIKYHEVRVPSHALLTRKVLTRREIDLADVQEGRGIFLDC